MIRKMGLKQLEVMSCVFMHVELINFVSRCFKRTLNGNTTLNKNESDDSKLILKSLGIADQYEDESDI